MTALLLPAGTVWVSPRLAIAIVPGDRKSIYDSAGYEDFWYPPAEWADRTGLSTVRWRCNLPLLTHDGPWHVDCCDGGGWLSATGSIKVVPVVADGYEGKAPFLLVDPDQNCVYYAPHEYRIRGGWEEVTLHFDPLPVPGRDWGIVIDCVEVMT